MVTSSLAVSRRTKPRPSKHRNSSQHLGTPLNNVLVRSPQSQTEPQNTQQHGLLISQGFSRQSDPISFGAKIQMARGSFSELGLYHTTRAPHITVQTFASYGSKNYGSMGVSYTERRHRKRADLKLMTLNYQKNIVQNFNLNVYASRDLKRKSSFIGLTLIYIIDDRSSAIATVQKQGKGHSKSVSYQATKVMDSNINYRVSASDTDGVYRQYETQVDVDQEVADYRLRASRFQKSNNIELNARGAVVYFDNKPFYQSISMMVLAWRMCLIFQMCLFTKAVAWWAKPMLPGMFWCPTWVDIKTTRLKWRPEIYPSKPYFRKIKCTSNRHADQPGWRTLM